MKIKYGEIPNELFCNYLKFLIGKVYKILPMREENNITLHEYMISLQKELIGNIELIESIKCDSNFLSLLNNIEYLICNECNEKEYKKIVFKSINIIEKIQKSINKEE